MATADRLSGAVARNRLASPYARPSGAVNGHRVLEIARVQRQFGGLSLQDWVQSARLQLGGDEELTRPLEQNDALYACTCVKANAVASVPLSIYPNDDPEAEPITSDADPIVKLFERPTPTLGWSWARFARRGVVNRVTTGEDWWFLAGVDGAPLQANAQGKVPTPTQIMQLSGAQVEIEFDMNPRSATYGYPQWFVYSAGVGTQVRFPPWSVLGVLELDDPYNAFRGLGPSDALARKLGLQFQIERYHEGVLREGGDAGAYVVMKEGGREQADALQQKLDDDQSNPNNRGRMRVVSGAVEVIPNTVAPKDMEFETGTRQNIEAICGAIGVPPELIGRHEFATYSNMESALAAMWTGPNGVVSYLKVLEDTLNNNFFPRLSDPRQSQYRAYFDISEIEALQADNTAKVEAAARIARTTQITFNEALATLNLEPIGPSGDKDLSVFAGLGGIGDDEESDTETDAPEQSAGPTAADVGASPSTVTGEGVTGQVLNGAQLASAVDIVAQVTAGTLPRDGALAMLETFFGLSAAEALAVMGSAGTGTPTTPNPNPADAVGDAPAMPQDEPDDDMADMEDMPEDEESKALRALTRRMGPITDKAERGAYWRGIEQAREAWDKLLLAIALKFLRKYEEATLKRVRSFAKNGARAIGAREIVSKHGLSPRAPLAVASADVAAWIERDLSAQLAEIDNHLLDVLLVNRREWETKMRGMFEPALRKVTAQSLAAVAEELESVSIGINSPQVIEALVTRATRLAEGVNGTLAKSVKRAIADVFASDSTIGDLQLAIRDKLPEVEGNIAKAFANKEARALAIARTESAGASETARFQQYRADGVAQIQWIAQGDNVVRESHAMVDGDVVPLGSRFANGLMYPHEEGAPANEVVNCRCSAISADS